MASEKQKMAGWIVSGIVALFLAGPSAMGKFMEWEGKAEMFEHLGYSQDLINKIGILEIANERRHLIECGVRESITGYRRRGRTCHQQCERAQHQSIRVSSSHTHDQLHNSLIGVPFCTIMTGRPSGVWYSL